MAGNEAKVFISMHIIPQALPTIQLLKTLHLVNDRSLTSSSNTPTPNGTIAPISFGKIAIKAPDVGNLL